MNLNHLERLLWVNELARINRTLNEAADGGNLD
jgi:hypothetical protein